MNSAPNSQPMRHTRRHWRGRPSEKMRVNSGGSSRYSATTFTPPSEMSVTTQSRGKPPVPNWIFARLLQIRRSLLRRFANILILSRSMPTLRHCMSFTKQSLGYVERKPLQSIICFRTHFIDRIDAAKWRASWPVVPLAVVTPPEAAKPLSICPGHHPVAFHASKAMTIAAIISVEQPVAPDGGGALPLSGARLSFHQPNSHCTR
jgi:hypothetical protein